MDEPRRSEFRTRTLLTGKLVFGAHDMTADCAIRNLANRGAKIRTAMASNLPRELWLIVINQGIAYRCAVIWRRDQDVGLTFLSKHDLGDERDPQLRVLRHVWRQLTAR